jgi:iron uptake system component EfeO
MSVVAVAVCGSGLPTGESPSVRSVPATAEVLSITAADRIAALRATATFRDELGNASSTFVTDVTRLQEDLQAGNVPAARTDELAAQAQFDQFRQPADNDPINASTLDELASEVGSGQSFGGLHAVERDLWEPASTGSGAGGIEAPDTNVAQAIDDVSGLAAQAPVAEYLLSKDSAAPEAIGVTGVDDLDWLDEVAVPEREELYSRLDAVDIAATTTAAHDAFVAIEPLAAVVAPALTATVGRRFDLLVAEVSALGMPTEVVDASLPPAGLLSISQQVDATAAGLAQLSGALAPFGTGGDAS